ncbi:uncharacterized protein [Typha latifolia]|uniref:uncharacterized protein n=1 Tax=Typha latifolia TaxID=4733 RepID=UPI003C2C4C42
MVIAAASPSPAIASRHLHHPPYKEMILTAIESLKERGGSSRRAISKFIGSTYSDLPRKHAALLALHIRRLKSKGVLDKVKNSYKISKSSAKPTSSDPSPRPRGRPRKSEETRPVSQNLEKRARGRPPKSLVPLIVPSGVKVRLKSEPDLEKPAMKKPRGRPPKNSASLVVGKRRPGRPPKAALAVTAAADMPKRKRGRPPKVEATTALSALIVFPAASLSELVCGAVRKKPGRPPKAKLEKRKPGRPPKKPEVEAVIGRKWRPQPGRPPKVTADVNSLNEKRKRGRPSKSMMIANSTAPPTAKRKLGRPRNVNKEGKVASPSGKRRGRPPKKPESSLPPMDGETKVVLEKKKGPGRPRKTVQL